jgi:putative phosphoribosyl transferase
MSTSLRAEHCDYPVQIPIGRTSLEGNLSLPHEVRGVVLFAHGSGSGRHSPRNRYVASVLQGAGLGTLLFDLLDESEALNRANVFDIDLLASRLQHAADWLDGQPETRGLAVGYFGASTGTAAALAAAGRRPRHVGAVVSRGGRPDLAWESLPFVQASTLLIVGGNDPEVLDLNREAFGRLACEKGLIVVPGATHLFSEPGTLEEVARLATDWFLQHLDAGGRGPSFPRSDMDPEC